MTDITADLKATELGLRGMRTNMKVTAANGDRGRDLDERALDFMRRADAGESYREIAAHWGVSTSTVAKTVQAVRREEVD